MTITLYGLGQSRSFRCLWALEEAKLDYNFVSLELGSDKTGGAKSSEYLKLNPQGKVPTLTHDDLTLTESAAILNYINSLSAASFIPGDNKQRAKYDELSFFVLAELEQPLWTTGKHKFAIPEEYRVSDIFKTAQWEFDKALKALSRLVDLSDNDYALGNTFSFADILLAQTFNWAESFKFELPDDYLVYKNKLYSRDAVKRALAKFSA